GADATRLIRQLPGAVSTVPIVALTADAIPEHRPGFLAAGANAVVVKPVVWRELGEVIDQLVPGAAIAQRVARGVVKPMIGEAGRPAPSDRNPDALPVVDHAVLDDLTNALGEAAVASMMPTFVANMVEYRDRLAGAIADNDLVGAKRAAHAMKGLAAQ